MYSLTFGSTYSVGTMGFEPTTFSSQMRRATKLRYVPSEYFDSSITSRATDMILYRLLDIVNTLAQRPREQDGVLRYNVSKMNL